jgi:hypothetical protein
VSRKKKRKQKRRNRDDCCILCELFGKAVEQDDSWSVSDRADELVAEMRAAQSWGGAFTGFLRSPRKLLDEFVDEWLAQREPLRETWPEEISHAADVAALAARRFWEGYQFDPEGARP